MHDPVETAFLEAAGRLIDPGRPLLVAISGGGDSVALARLVAQLSSRRRPPTTLAHLDHGLRDGAGEERRFVERLADELGLPCLAERRPVVARPDESPAEAARRVRRAFLLEAAAREDAAVATGHTLDDQAETILMRWARGAGPAALAGIDERGPGPFVRPLLAVERAALRDWLRSRGHAWCDDPTNDDPRFERTRARRLIGALRAELNPALLGHLADAARRLRDDAACLDALAATRFEALHRTGDRDVRLDVAALADEPLALAGRIAALALRRAGVDPRRLLAHHVDALVDLARGADGRRLDLPGPRRAERRGREIRIVGLVD